MIAAAVASYRRAFNHAYRRLEHMNACLRKKYGFLKHPLRTARVAIRSISRRVNARTRLSFLIILLDPTFAQLSRRLFVRSAVSAAPTLKRSIKRCPFVPFLSPDTRKPL